MFICERCNKQSEPGESPERTVTATRVKKYREGGVGTEIVREENLCKTCSEVYE